MSDIEPRNLDDVTNEIMDASIGDILEFTVWVTADMVPSIKIGSTFWVVSPEKTVKAWIEPGTKIGWFPDDEKYFGQYVIKIYDVQPNRFKVIKGDFYEK